MEAAKTYPFKFLDAYSQADKDIFFGRDEEVNILYDMTFQSDILLVYGRSGTGKTSLIQCGLANKFQSYDWLALTIRRGTDINRSLQSSLEEAAGGVPDASEMDFDTLFRDNEASSEKSESILASALRKVYLNQFRPIYLIFDQFEELYILGSKTEKETFIAAIQEMLALEQPVKVIFSIREEYLGHLYEFEKSIPQLLRKKLRVEPMNLAKVKQIIGGIGAMEDSLVRVANEDRETFSEMLFEKIKGEEKTIGIQLPYLQVFLDKIYMQVTSDEKRQTEARFTPENLQMAGDIGDVLRDFLEDRILKTTQNLRKENAEITNELLWKILSQFVTLEGTKEPIDPADIYSKFSFLGQTTWDSLVAALTDNRILKFTESSGLFEIAHDSLALTIADKRSDEEIARLEIKRLIKSHTTLSSDASEFLSERQLNLIEPYFQELALSPEETDLVENSRVHLASQKRKKRRRLILGFSAIVVALIAMSVLAFVAYQNKIEAANERDAAEEAKNTAEKNLQDFLKEKAEKETIEFNNLESRAKIIANVQGCPKEIVEQMKAIAQEDSLLNARINALTTYCPKP